MLVRRLRQFCVSELRQFLVPKLRQLFASAYLCPPCMFMSREAKYCLKISDTFLPLEIDFFFLRLRSSGAGSALLPSNARLDKSPCGSTSRRPAPGGLAKAVGTGLATADLRGAMTFLAAICDQAHVQPKLPQLIIGNKAKLTQTVLKNASRHKPQAVHLQAQTSAWNNRGTVAKNLGLLGDSLKPFRKEFLHMYCWTARRAI